jgi:methylenetetrahydrofolate reductase (NADPH)
VRIGAAAPTNTLRMMKFALRCGIGPSLRALDQHAARFGEVLANAGPEALVADLAEGLGAEDMGAALGMHFFVFGGVKQSAEWLTQWREALSAKGL